MLILKKPIPKEELPEIEPESFFENMMNVWLTKTGSCWRSTRIFTLIW